MNFVFISPHFPVHFWHYCDRLKKNGVTVLGVGDAPYDQLAEGLKNSLTEYYRVDNMEDYDQMLRALGYFTHRYGKIDWIESNNEYWLEQDARLRSDFNVTTGLKAEEIERYKSKSGMKAYYAKAGVPTARYQIVGDKASVQKFVEMVGYPIVIKPDKGVGSGDTWKITNEEQMDLYFASRRDIPYVMEEFVDGEIATFDGVSDRDGNPICAISHVTPGSIMDVVNDGTSLYYYVDKEMPENLRKAGEATQKAFDASNRFFHQEFFRLLSDKEGLGKKGDIVGLEVNMRAAGGNTVDMMNFAASMDLYQIWADMVAFGEARHEHRPAACYCASASRRNSLNYAHSHEEIMAKYGDVMKLDVEVPAVMSGCMGDRMYIACLPDREALDEYRAFVQGLAE
ncbi:MAG: ATP-grasp domain-containing protein [Oscillospiraceae bacterium]|nr:ATP-grasp domain-containing protein [Oscillospiraceae bacterium]